MKNRLERIKWKNIYECVKEKSYEKYTDHLRMKIEHNFFLNKS